MRRSSLFLLAALVGACSSDDGKSDAALQAPEQLPNSDEWHSLGYDAHNTRHNRGETLIGASNVASLKPKWVLLDVDVGVTSTPAVVDGIVYFGEWGGTVRAVRAADGSELWRTPVRGRPSASPLVVGDRIYVSAGREVFALRRSDGAELWSKVLDEHPNVNLDSSPVWADGRIVVGVASFELALPKEDYTFRGSVVALDAENGDLLWQVHTSQNDSTSGAGVSVWSSAAVDTKRKLVFIGTGQTYEEPASPLSDAIMAIKYETGEVRWVYQYTEGDVFVMVPLGPGKDYDIGAAPNLFRIGNRDVVGAGSKGGYYKALDRDTGDPVWEVEFGIGSPLGGIMSISAVDDERVYVSSNLQGASSITAAFDRETGESLWQTPLPSPVYGALTLANGVLYHPSTQGIAYALDAATGTELWSVDLQANLAGGISVVGGTVYVPRGFTFLTMNRTDAGGLVAFSLDGAAELDFTRDAGTDAAADAAVVTPAECASSAPGSLVLACRDCACNCDAPVMASCDQSCWDLYRCVVDNCAAQFSDAGTGTDAGAARACVEQACTDVKLLPFDIQQATLAAAPCMVECQSSCP